MGTIQTNVLTVLTGVVCCAAAWAQTAGGTWIYSIPGPDGTSRDTYFRLKEMG
jgi:hypothetical protein